MSKDKWYSADLYRQDCMKWHFTYKLPWIYNFVFLLQDPGYSTVSYFSFLNTSSVYFLIQVQCITNTSRLRASTIIFRQFLSFIDILISQEKMSLWLSLPNKPRSTGVPKAPKIREVCIIPCRRMITEESIIPGIHIHSTYVWRNPRKCNRVRTHQSRALSLRRTLGHW